MLEAIVGCSRESISDCETAAEWDAAVDGASVPCQQGGRGCSRSHERGHTDGHCR
jgi:hypothetical protein